MQTEVYFAGDLQRAAPAVSAQAVRVNQVGVGYLGTALFGVQLAAGYAGVKGTEGQLRRVCGEIEAVLIDNLFTGFEPGGGGGREGFCMWGCGWDGGGCGNGTVRGD